jgi:site-specific DNA-methyltransferase (adenine-specific)
MTVKGQRQGARDARMDWTERGAMNNVHFSSKSDEYSTPQWLFDLLDSEFHFGLDAWATAANAKCEMYFSPTVDSLKQEWRGTIYCNPPYSRCGPCVEKAYYSSLLGATVVCLIPARTDTTYWHRFVTKAYEIRFLKGRLKFGNEKNSAPFPSAIVVFKPGNHVRPITNYVDLAEVQGSLFGC